MDRARATTWLAQKLREEREIAIAQGAGWNRRDIADAVKEKYEGSDEWLQVQAALASSAVFAQMLRILQGFARKLNEANEAELDGAQMALDGLSLRSSYVVSPDGTEQATELMTGNEARLALRLLDMRIADDTVSRNRLLAAMHRYPQWVDETTLLEAVAGVPA